MWEGVGGQRCAYYCDLEITSVLGVQQGLLCGWVTVWTPPDDSLPLDSRLSPVQAGALRVKSLGGLTASRVLVSLVGCAPAVLAAGCVCWDVQSPKHLLRCGGLREFLGQSSAGLPLQ